MKILQRFIYVFVFAAMTIGFAGCEDDGGDGSQTSNLTVDFYAMFGDEDLMMNEKMDLEGTAIRINVSSFYISEIDLNSSENGQSRLSDVEFVNFTDAPGSSSSITFSDIPVGTYESMTFHIGVTSEMNQRVPEDFPSDHPLAKASNYWQGWSSYIFSKLEGKIDTSGDGSTDLTFIYHSGKDDLYTEIEVVFDQPLQIDAADKSIALNVDHKKLLEDGGGYLDIALKPTAHNAEDLEYPTKIMSNFKSSFENR